jgi:pyruvate/2-oxoglutarate dehydrogenase complex dihydrolipoamide acyltransferase (E2) component
MFILKMPKADENMAEATVIKWLVAEGDRVEAEQDVVECVADKGDFMLYSEIDGIVRRVYAAENSVVPIGYVVAIIGEADEQLPAVEAENAALMARAHEALTATEGLQVRKSERVRATPVARRLAKELGVDLSAVSAALGGALVREDDVRRHADSSGGKE